MYTNKLSYTKAKIGTKDISINQRMARSTDGSQLLRFNPLSILGTKLQFWFDNTDISRITFGSSGGIQSQTDQTGNFIRKQDTLGAQPAWANGIITSDGIGDWLNLRTPADAAPSSLFSDTQGFYLHIVSRDVTDVFTLNSANDTASDTRFWYPATMVASSAGAEPNSFRTFQRNNDTSDRVYGDTTFTAGDNGVFFALACGSNGSRYKLYINGIDDGLNVGAGADNGDWIGDVANVDNFVFYSLQRQTKNYYGFNEKQVLYMSEEPTADELIQLSIWASKVI